MTQKIYSVTDLGPGDGGKGGIVHKLTHMLRPHTVIKRGGAQGSHGVQTSHGEKFNFSQWGCGTLEGVSTFISEQFVVLPIGLLNEADALRRYGIYDPFELLSIDKRCVCATPYHGIASHIKELARGASPRGTIGTGVGEAYRRHRLTPEASIRVEDLAAHDLEEKLWHIAKHFRQELMTLIEDESLFLPDDRELLRNEVELLFDDEYFKFILEKFQTVGKLIRLSSLPEILSRNGVAVVESSHGVLTDSVVGFTPHTSAIRTLPRFTAEMLQEAGFNGRLINLGVHRAYSIRHGAGPLPTNDPAMLESLLPGSHKDVNRWQGSVRVGPLDFCLLNYAIEQCGGAAAFDGLCITWFDQVVKNGIWNYCSEYKNIQELIGSNLNPTTKFFKAEPKISNISIDQTLSHDALYQVCHDLVVEKTGIPVRMVSFGATEQARLYK